MPNVGLMIGGRNFDVVCDPGQEAHLERAAALLDAEAGKLTADKLTESRLLLLAGLMLADKVTEAEQSLEIRDQRIRQLEAELTRAGNGSTANSGELAQAKSGALAAHQLLERVTDVLEEIAERSKP